MKHLLTTAILFIATIALAKAPESCEVSGVSPTLVTKIQQDSGVIIKQFEGQQYAYRWDDGKGNTRSNGPSDCSSEQLSYWADFNGIEEATNSCSKGLLASETCVLASANWTLADCTYYLVQHDELIKAVRSFAWNKSLDDAASKKACASAFKGCLSAANGHPGSQCKKN